MQCVWYKAQQAVCPCFLHEHLLKDTNLPIIGLQERDREIPLRPFSQPARSLLFHINIQTEKLAPTGGCNIRLNLHIEQVSTSVLGLPILKKMHIIKCFPTPCTGVQSIILGIVQGFAQPLNFVLLWPFHAFCAKFQGAKTADNYFQICFACLNSDMPKNFSQP